MTNSLIIFVFIVLIILIYISFYNKIRSLEDKISELSKKIDISNTARAEIKDSPAVPNQNITFDIPQEIKNKNKETLHPEEQMDWLAPVFDFLKQNALTIIGIFTLVLGIGYFVKYAIDKNWIGESARVEIGFFIGVLLIGTGHFLRKNYAVFSSIIMGGGITVLYFTTTIAFREYHLFTQNTAFGITCLVTLISIALSYFYKNEILIFFSLFGGFLAPLMISNGQSNYPFLFIYLTILNIGMLAIVFLKNWKSVGWISYVFTTAYLLYWTAEKTEILTVYFYIATYIIFYVSALQEYIKKNILSTFNILMLVLINSSSILGIAYIFNQENYQPVIIFPLIFGCINAYLLYREYQKKNFGINYSVFAGISISLLTIAIALQFKTHLITSVWAVEATLLLFIWKKTNLNIFKICFYILFPLVIIAQMMTWGEYLDAKSLNIIFNPVFLTSLVTVATTFTNLILLRKIPENSQSENSFYENMFKILSFGVIYISLLLEIIYHISEQPFINIATYTLLFSIYYIFALLTFRKKLDINAYLESGIIYLFLILVFYHTAFSGTEISRNILRQKTDLQFYFIYLLYLIPFAFVIWKFFTTSGFFKTKTSYWAIAGLLTAVVSYELNHLYILGSTPTISDFYPHQKHFSILYLPIIWAVLASIFIYSGLKQSIPELSRIGFSLIGIMILKLYAYDVWQMDNVSRIIAFIILGVILLLSSFTFQRLKNIIINLVDKKEENNENESLKS